MLAISFSCAVGFPQLGQGRLGRGGIGDARKHGLQGAHGRVHLVRQVHASDRQICRGSTDGYARRLCRCGRNCRDDIAASGDRMHTRRDRQRWPMRGANKASCVVAALLLSRKLPGRVRKLLRSDAPAILLAVAEACRDAAAHASLRPRSNRARGGVQLIRQAGGDHRRDLILLRTEKRCQSACIEICASLLLSQYAEDHRARASRGSTCPNSRRRQRTCRWTAPSCPPPRCRTGPTACSSRFRQRGRRSNRSKGLSGFRESRIAAALRRC